MSVHVLNILIRKQRKQFSKTRNFTSCFLIVRFSVHSKISCVQSNGFVSDNSLQLCLHWDNLSLLIYEVWGYDPSPRSGCFESKMSLIAQKFAPNKLCRWDIACCTFEFLIWKESGLYFLTKTHIERWDLHTSYWVFISSYWVHISSKEVWYTVKKKL